MKNFLGIEIGGTKLQLVLGDENARISERFRFAVDPSKGSEQIRTMISDTVRQVRSSNLQAVGVGFGGPINWKTGQVWTSHQVGGWTGFPLVQWLKEISGVEVFADNDANVAALGEASLGAGRNSVSVFYVTLGSGVGGGLVIGKSIFHGEEPGEVEFGHLRLDKSGRTLESSCSGWAVDARIRASASNHPDGELARLTKGLSKGEAAILSMAVANGDPEGIRILNETADDLALGLSHVVHLFHPTVIIAGGGLSLVGETLTQRAKEKLSYYLMEAFKPGPSIHLSQLSEDSVTVGALILAINNYKKR